MESERNCIFCQKYLIQNSTVIMLIYHIYAIFNPLVHITYIVVEIHSTATLLWGSLWFKLEPCVAILHFFFFLFLLFFYLFIYL
jgi:hypothetical protein